MATEERVDLTGLELEELVAEILATRQAKLEVELRLKRLEGILAKLLALRIGEDRVFAEGRLRVSCREQRQVPGVRDPTRTDLERELRQRDLWDEVVLPTLSFPRLRKLLGVLADAGGHEELLALCPPATVVTVRHRSQPVKPGRKTRRRRRQ